MQVNGQMAAGDSEAALKVIRAQWGYMLNNANSTQSTFWEGYQADGQYAFGGIYMSHAHGWAAGAGSALSNYLLGLQPRIPFRHNPSVAQDATCSFLMQARPAHSLQFVNGSQTYPCGTVHAAWSWDPNVVAQARVENNADKADGKVLQVIVDTTQIMSQHLPVGHVAFPRRLLQQYMAKMDSEYSHWIFSLSTESLGTQLQTEWTGDVTDGMIAERVHSLLQINAVSHVELTAVDLNHVWLQVTGQDRFIFTLGVTLLGEAQ
jgi:hypothetical protein